MKTLQEKILTKASKQYVKLIFSRVVHPDDYIFDKGDSINFNDILLDKNIETKLSSMLYLTLKTKDDYFYVRLEFSIENFSSDAQHLYNNKTIIIPEVAKFKVMPGFMSIEDFDLNNLKSTLTNLSDVELRINDNNYSGDRKTDADKNYRKVNFTYDAYEQIVYRIESFIKFQQDVFYDHIKKTIVKEFKN